MSSWGGHFTRCGRCKPAMWFYLYPPPSDPVGAGVRVRERARRRRLHARQPDRLAHRQTAIRVGQILEQPVERPALAELCTGYSAKPTQVVEGRGDVDPHAGRRGLRLRAHAAVRLALP